MSATDRIMTVSNDFSIISSGGDVNLTANNNTTITASQLTLATGTLSTVGQATTISIIDNNASSLKIAEGANDYLTFNTTNGSESISFGQSVQFTSGLDFSGFVLIC